MVIVEITIMITSNNLATDSQHLLWRYKVVICLLCEVAIWSIQSTYSYNYSYIAI